MNSKNLLSSRSLFLATILALVVVVSCKDNGGDPEPEFTYAGNYNGFWNTNVQQNNQNFQDQISATFEEIDENIFIGAFFYSNNLNPCCGVDGDGEISFKLEGDSLKQLIFNQDFRTFGFSGFACSGTFTGDGVINEDGNLAFKISGTDCAGSHVGTILLRRLEE